MENGNAVMNEALRLALAKRRGWRIEDGPAAGKPKSVGHAERSADTATRGAGPRVVEGPVVKLVDGRRCLQTRTVDARGGETTIMEYLADDDPRPAVAVDRTPYPWLPRNGRRGMDTDRS